ncbi:MAG: ABC transporter ATP-binding protein [Clostridiaceae bacterium]|jgi:putative ABC transport system ATP-binding protein|nr:ABC transporter ATP-binding protein [Clostridiaceae bacterium]
MGESILKLKNVNKIFETDAGEVQVLKNINMTIDKGELIGVFGKSGSGKSTLMNMITGIDRPTDGEVWINSEPIHKYGESKMAVWRGSNVGIVFQFFQLLPMLTVLENIILPMDFCNKYSKKDRRERALLMLKKLEVEEQAHKYPTALSGGQQQRVAIARALANEPSIIVADEPTGNLDSKTSKVIFNVFKQQAKEGKTVIIVTHDNSLKDEFTKNYVISDGQIIN